mgnify:CR=1 FL=1
MNTQKDNINPDHYKRNKLECIDVMREVYGKEQLMSFCRLNTFKYLFRHELKNGVEDLKKAQWYLEKLISLYDEVQF